MKEDKKLILVVEDEEAIAMGLEENLKSAGYDVITAATGPNGLDLGISKKPDLVLLDLMLPGMSGFDICRKFRDQGLQMPVIILTARKDEFDKLHGFEMGADDYVTKPFSIGELLARVKAVLLRGRRPGLGGKQYEFGNWILDCDTRELRVNKLTSQQVDKSVQKEKKRATTSRNLSTCQPVSLSTTILTKTEFDLLVYFCENEGKVLTRDAMMNDVWGAEYYGTQRSIDTFVANLRAKIEEDTEHPKHIITVHGVGYKFVGKKS